MTQISAAQQTATVYARLDSKTKRKAEKVLRASGMTQPEAVCLLYRQIAQRGEFPVELSVPHALTAKTLDKSDRNDEIEHFDFLKTIHQSWQKA